MSLFLLRLRRQNPLPSALTTAVRSMAGGPRTFPGGLNKWQYKRMHEKLAKEKERKLLHQEKQLYQARLRSEIRARAAGAQFQLSDDHPASSFIAMSSKDHIKALADRFLKPGAEDLWNEDDGPISLNPKAKPLDLKKIGRDERAKLGSFEKRRGYSTWRRNLSSDDEDEVVGVGKGIAGGGLITEKMKISRFFSGAGEREEEGRGDDGNERKKKMMSGAALGKFDRKKERRARRGGEMEEEEEMDLMEQIRGIREEIRIRGALASRVKEKEECATKEGSVLTQKR